MTPSDAALLVVDDNEDNRYTLTRRLKREGYTNLTTANDGLEALQLLRSKKFDLLLLDIMMPEMNGYEVLEHLKADAELRHLPVIMISAVGEVDSVVRCIELGAEDYLPKPFDATLLRARVGASLEKKAETAIGMALEMQQHFAPLRAAWKKRGFDLDLGIGIAQGYATLGAVGFEGRWEYTCIGSVANLASRLCNEAKGGQILINQKTLSRIEDAVEAEFLGEVMLKGIAQPVQTFKITALKL